MEKLANIFSSWALTSTTQIDPTFGKAYQYVTVCNIAKNIYLFMKVATALYFIRSTKSYPFYVWAASIFAVCLLQIIYSLKLAFKLLEKSNRSQIARFLGFNEIRNELLGSEQVLTINNGSLFRLEDAQLQQGNIKWIIYQIQKCIDSIDRRLWKLKQLQFVLDQIMQIYGLGLLMLFEMTDKWDRVYLICILYIGTYEYMEHYLLCSFKVFDYISNLIAQTSLTIKHKWKLYRFNVSMTPVAYSHNIQGFHQCSICLSAYYEKDQILVLKCSCLHHFHAVCIHQWMANSTTCPICRADLFDL